MSDIAPIQNPAAAALSLNNPVQRSAAAQTTDSTRDSDQVDFSSTARAFAQLNDASGVRQELVARIRDEIAAGTYETPEKLDAAVEGLAQDLSS